MDGLQEIARSAEFLKKKRANTTKVDLPPEDGPARPDDATHQTARARAVRMPMPDPHQTASGTVSESPLVLTDDVATRATSGTASCSPTRRLLWNRRHVSSRTWRASSPESRWPRSSSRTSCRGVSGCSARRGSSAWRSRPSTWRCGCAGALPGAPAVRASRRLGQAGSRLRCDRLRRRGPGGGGRGSVGVAGIHRRQGEDRLCDRRRGCRGDSGDPAGCWRSRGDHGRLQPGPHACRGGGASP